MDTDSARELVQQLPERVRDWPERLGDALPQRAVNLLPDAAQERLGRKRRRPRWLLIGVLAGLAAGGIWLALKVKSVLAPGYDEDEDDEELLGEPFDYPAAGAGTGWPEGARSRENTEVMGERSAAAAPVASVPPPMPPAPPAPPPVVASPHLASGGAALAGETGRLAADTAAPERTGFERPRDLDATLAFPLARDTEREPEHPRSPDPKQALAGTVWAESRDVGPAQPSEPAQRPPIPFTESQAETNARLQLQQDALFEAFPGITRGDLVESDGDLDRLAVIIATRLNRPIDDVRGRIDALLSTGAPQQKADAGIEPDLSVREG